MRGEGLEGLVQGNRSVVEGLEILLGVAQAGGGVGVRELGRRLGLTPTRVQRYLATYAVLGMVERLAGGRYRVGPGIHTLSAIAQTASGLAGRAMRHLPGLGGRGHIVALGVLWRGTVSYLYFRQGRGGEVAEALGRAEGYPAEESSIGILLMALGGMEAEGEIGERLARVRRQGYACVLQPSGETSIAVAVGVPVVAGLAISGQIGEGEVAGLVEQLRATAKKLVPEEQ